MKPIAFNPVSSVPPAPRGTGLVCTACGGPGAVEFMDAVLCPECYQQGASSCAGGRDEDAGSAAGKDE